MSPHQRRPAVVACEGCRGRAGTSLRTRWRERDRITAIDPIRGTAHEICVTRNAGCITRPAFRITALWNVVMQIPNCSTPLGSCVTQISGCITAEGSCVTQISDCITAEASPMMQLGVAVTLPESGVMREPFPAPQERLFVSQGRCCDTGERRLVSHPAS